MKAAGFILLGLGALLTLAALFAMEVALPLSDVVNINLLDNRSLIAGAGQSLGVIGAIFIGAAYVSDRISPRKLEDLPEWQREAKETRWSDHTG